MQQILIYRIPQLNLAYENLFWLRIFRDHCQFIMETLSPGQTGLITQVQQFYQIFDRLLGIANDTSDRFLQEVAGIVAQFRCYKLSIIDLQLGGENPINLPLGAFNEMLDEDDEYLKILKVIPRDQQVIPREQPLNEATFLFQQHLLWLPNQAAHAALIRAQLDPAESALFDIYNRYQILFSILACKVMELKGLMRDKPRLVASLIYTTRESAGLTAEFRQSIENYRDLRATAQVLATSPSLLADHLSREAGYYLGKIDFGIMKR